MTPAIGYDIDPKLVDKKKSQKYQKLQTSFLHICIPFTDRFTENVIALSKMFKPKGVIIHSTISPGTTSKLQSQLPIPVIYSATRGVHKRMLYDLKRYVKFFADEIHKYLGNRPKMFLSRTMIDPNGIELSTNKNNICIKNHIYLQNHMTVA